VVAVSLKNQATEWGGSRRLAVRVAEVAGAEIDRDERVLGPPAAIAFDDDGRPTKAALGFAKKQGVEPRQLERHSTDKGEYVGFVRAVRGRSVGQVLDRGLPREVETMSFPKTMRWGEGRWRWVRPVHWVLALHGADLLDLELFGVRSGGWSSGHRFLSNGRVAVPHAEAYHEALASAHVIVDPAERRRRLGESLERSAGQQGGRLVEDTGLLEEVGDLVEWPGTVSGAFGPDFLELPRELLVTTLRHHQKCFSVQNETGALLPAFVAVANTDRDPQSHVRRGNEWVIGGRLEDARFFWNADRKSSLADRSAQLDGVVFHAKCGTFADKARRLEELAGRIASLVGLSEEQVEHCRRAAFLAKNDLVTGTVGEFPELQGQVGGLLLRAEGESEEVALAVYAHYRPAGSDDPIPTSPEGLVVALADKLDTLESIICAGERPTGSKDPFGLRRAGNGVLRILLESGWSASLHDLFGLLGHDSGAFVFLRERLVGFFRDRGFTINEIHAVIRPQVDELEAFSWPLADLAARLEAIQAVRDRDDFRSLVKLTERVETIVVKNADTVKALGNRVAAFTETQDSALSLAALVDALGATMDEQSRGGEYAGIVQSLASFVDPVERFFTDVLVIDGNHPAATRRRYELLSRLEQLLTKYFDIRELAGQAERSTA
jgi:glycyl-tRNA synthetase beta chain